MKKIYVVGLGPGSRAGMSFAAAAALDEAEVLCGYKTYIDLIRDDYPDKPVLQTPMTKEVERCRLALAEAAAGRTVAMVCSGDPGVYGMAGLLYELAGEYPAVEIEVVPGVSAAQSGAAVLGAPLMHDFAVISLSDLLTPWDVILKRLKNAAEGDFVLCLYNPASHGRPQHLARACDTLLEVRTPGTVCGWVRNIGREGEEAGLLSLAELRDYPADMFTTVFVGSSRTRNIDGRMVTPRGYSES